MADLDWAGCYNVRDLGGLPVRGGGLTRRRHRVLVLGHRRRRGRDAALLPPVSRAQGGALRGRDRRGGGDPIVERLAERGTTIAEFLTELLTEVDIESRLTTAGLGAAEVRAVRARMLS